MPPSGELDVLLSLTALRTDERTPSTSCVSQKSTLIVCGAAQFDSKVISGECIPYTMSLCPDLFVLQASTPLFPSNVPEHLTPNRRMGQRRETYKIRARLCMVLPAQRHSQSTSYYTIISMDSFLNFFFGSSPMESEQESSLPIDAETNGGGAGISCVVA
ncbi:hypothetical protein BV25DRAFT_1823365 [Artomyces pyxidatus]|uniref:Uncharacterized protein n=1 Tax=Artomyces pyxidatus TaxID=48021 RepID=A0ACB8T6J0_9AGAM|nr:hypothetical protein BV25DRAFT_1823365 [Artomyces pyxidatus]